MFHRRLTFVAVLALTACGKAEEKPVELDQPALDFQSQLIERLIDAKPGDVIDIPEGVYVFDRSLALTVDGVTIRGAGMDKTVLNFKNQIAGAEGLLVTASDFTIEDLAIEDTIGDALKVNEGDNIVIRNVRTEWTRGPDTKNGAYGIYPVQTTNVLLEGNIAIGASDAGIYVGQSKNVIVRNNRAEYNVAGIEIENTVDADVYGNVATNNTGGILVFNMPALQQAGYGVRVYDNDVFENNTKNFGHPGTPVASVPAGSGVVINSHDAVEVFENRIANNKTANIIISSLFSTGYSDSSMSESFDPYPEGVYIYGNAFEGGGDAPDGNDLKLLKVAKFGLNGSFPDVIWDGYVDQSKYVEGSLPAGLRICVDNGETEVLNVDGPNKYNDPRVEKAPFQCAQEKLKPVELG